VQLHSLGHPPFAFGHHVEEFLATGEVGIVLGD
jgi:hypothetical protein